MPNKYSCPKCGKELSEADVVRGICSHCHSVFEIDFNTPAREEPSKDKSPEEIKETDQLSDNKKEIEERKATENVLKEQTKNHKREKVESYNMKRFNEKEGKEEIDKLVQKIKEFEARIASLENNLESFKGLVSVGGLLGGGSLVGSISNIQNTLQKFAEIIDRNTQLINQHAQAINEHLRVINDLVRTVNNHDQIVQKLGGGSRF